MPSPNLAREFCGEVVRRSAASERNLEELFSEKSLANFFEQLVQSAVNYDGKGNVGQADDAL